MAFMDFANNLTTKIGNYPFAAARQRPSENTPGRNTFFFFIS
jgi:hypothetical protein